MIWWLILAVYGGGVVMTWRRVGWFLATDMSYGTLDGADIFFGVWMGFFIALGWPIVVPGVYLYKQGWLYSAGRSFLKPPASVKRRVVLEERERQVRDRERRIERLERDVGIGA